MLIRMMRADFDELNVASGLPDRREHLFMDTFKRSLVEQASAKTGLIAGNRDPEPGPREARDCVNTPGEGPPFRC
jgi:hypothetical protein